MVADSVRYWYMESLCFISRNKFAVTYLTLYLRLAGQLNELTDKNETNHQMVCRIFAKCMCVFIYACSMHACMYART